jgi:hypothetical protein
MYNLIEHRKRVYENLPKIKLSNESTDIVLFYDISESNYEKLKKATQEFILKNLSVFYKEKYTWSEDFLEKNESLINSLPSKTPNGVIFPKKETIQEFEEMQRSINQIFRDLKIWPHIKKMVIPNVRFKSVNENQDAKNRPYYTGKLHSDAWVGHQGDSVFLIGVLGDIDNNTVEFNEPIGTKFDYLHKAKSFDEGNSRYESLKYLGTLKSQKLCIMDHACLHKTYLKENSKPRISIDIAVLIESEYSHVFDEGFDESVYNYHDSVYMEKIGITKNYKIETSIFENIPSKIEII